MTLAVSAVPTGRDDDLPPELNRQPDRLRMLREVKAALEDEEARRAAAGKSAERPKQSEDEEAQKQGG